LNELSPEIPVNCEPSPMKYAAVILPVAFMSPITVNSSVGLSVPIPTLLFEASIKKTLIPGPEPSNV